METNFKSKLVSIIFLLLVSGTPFYAQNKMSGLVLDAKKEPASYVPVLLVSSKDTLSVEYTLADSIGRFSFKVKQPGTYCIRIKAMGFKEYMSQPISLDAANPLALPEIVLEEDNTFLEEVVIVGKKPLFIQKTDRMVFNVENSLSSQGGDALDVLKNTPLLKVEETSISMIGKSGLNVLLNGRPIALSGEALISYLSTISSDKISKIEIITTPPAKYAAEGNAGFINIILKKNPNLGFSGTFSSAATQRTYLSTRNSTNLNYQTEKLAIAANLLYSDTEIAAYEKDQNVFSDGFFSTNRQDKIVATKDWAPSVQLNYQWKPKTEVSFVYEYNNSDFTSNDRSTSLFYDDSVLMNRLLNKGDGSIGSDFHRAHAFVTSELDTLGKSVEFGFQWLDNSIKNKRDNQINNNGEAAATRNFSWNKYQLGVLNLDLNLPFEKIAMQAGARYTFLDNNSDVRFYDIVADIPELNPALTNVFNYKEQIGALYVSSEIKAGTQWTFQGGLRYENTHYTGKSKEEENSIRRNYDNFFPTFYASYNHSDHANYSFRYSKRVNRPRLEQLNPFQWYINPFQYVEGNPLLLPSFTDNLELAYSNNSNLSATLYHSITKGEVSYLVEFLDNGKIQRYSYYNLLDVYQYGVYVNYTFTKIKNWQSQLSGSYYWQETKSDDTSLVPATKGNGGNVLLDNSFKIDNKNTVQFNYRHNFPSFNGTSATKPFGFLTLSYRTSFLDKQLSAGITASTIISKRNEIAYTQIRDNASLTRQNEYDYQSLRLNFTYKFGNSKVKGSKQKSEAEEAARIK